MSSFISQIYVKSAVSIQETEFAAFPLLLGSLPKQVNISLHHPLGIMTRGTVLPLQEIIYLLQMK